MGIRHKNKSDHRSCIRLVAVEGSLRHHIVEHDRNKIGLPHGALRVPKDFTNQFRAWVRLAVPHPANLCARPPDSGRQLISRLSGGPQPFVQRHGRQLTRRTITPQAECYPTAVELHAENRDHRGMANKRKREGRPVVGLAVLTRREQKGWTQEQLAEHARLSEATISRIETGAAGWSSTSIAKIAAALNCAPGELIDGIDPNSIYADLHEAIDHLAEHDAKRLLAILRAMTEVA